MEETVIEGLESKLTTLWVAREQLRLIEGDLESAESLYRYAIKVLETAMEADPMVIEIREKLNTMRQIEEDATLCTSKAAISAWQEGLTDGKKEWRHGNWEIRLRTTLKPIVTEIKDFIDHVHRIGAHSIIKSITLNRRATTDLDRSIGPLTGLEIEEKITCSVKGATK